MTLVNLMDSVPMGLAPGLDPSSVKVIRMHGLPLREESHPSPEALLVLDGHLELDVCGSPVSLSKGELYLLPAGTPHTARRGSHGTLAIVQLQADLTLA
jgi:quercetin dioxygenase-like cupin family protein